jgi:hypothetical protein
MLIQGSAQETILKAGFRGVAKTTGFAAHAAIFSPNGKDVAKFYCLFFVNGNRISQQRFMPEDLSLRARF